VNPYRPVTEWVRMGRASGGVEAGADGPTWCGRFLPADRVVGSLLTVAAAFAFLRASGSSLNSSLIALRFLRLAGALAAMLTHNAARPWENSFVRRRVPVHLSPLGAKNGSFSSGLDA